MTNLAVTKAKAWAARRQLLKRQYQQRTQQPTPWGRQRRDEKVQEEAEAEVEEENTQQQGERATVLQSMLKKEKVNLIETQLKIEMIENELKKITK